MLPPLAAHNKKNTTQRQRGKVSVHDSDRFANFWNLQYNKFDQNQSRPDVSCAGKKKKKKLANYVSYIKEIKGQPVNRWEAVKTTLTLKGSRVVCKVIFWLSHAKPLFLWDRQWDADEVWWDLWEVCSTKLLIAESFWPISVISLSLVGGDMLPGKGYHHGLVWNQILLSQPLTSLLYDRMWKLTWISAWGQCLPLSGEYDVSLRSRTSL